MMERIWWEQVGPRRFCTEVVRALQNTSVAVCFPLCSSENLLEGFDGIFDGIDCYLDADESPDPATIVKADMGDSVGDTIDLIFEKTGVIVVKNIKISTWPSWCAFVETYHRQLSAAKRSVRESARFLLITKGIAEEALRPLGVDLKVLLYKGRIGFLDTEQYCASALESKVSTGVEQRLKAAVIAQLALGDKALADWLCGKELSLILSPVHILQKYAEQRRVTAQTPGSWHAGTQDIIEGEKLDSSLILAVRNDIRTLSNRLWRAQLKVLFPYIEERRCDFVDLVREHLLLPNGANLIDFEFARLAWVITSHLKKEDRDAGQTYIDIANAFGNVRNSLAHKSPAPAILLDRMFQASVRLDDLIVNGPVKALRGRTASST